MSGPHWRWPTNFPFTFHGEVIQPRLLGAVAKQLQGRAQGALLPANRLPAVPEQVQLGCAAAFATVALAALDFQSNIRADAGCRLSEAQLQIVRCANGR